MAAGTTPRTAMPSSGLWISSASAVLISHSVTQLISLQMLPAACSLEERAGKGLEMLPAASSLEERAGGKPWMLPNADCAAGRSSWSTSTAQEAPPAWAGLETAQGVVILAAFLSYLWANAEGTF